MPAVNLLIEPSSPLDGQQWAFLLKAQDYGRFLSMLFKLYVRDLESKRPIRIRYFANLLHVAVGNRPKTCHLQGHCTVQFVDEADGVVYPCDSYVTDQCYPGNINDASLLELSRSRAASKFLQSLVDCMKTATIALGPICAEADADVIKSRANEGKGA